MDSSESRQFLVKKSTANKIKNFIAVIIPILTVAIAIIGILLKSP